MAKPQVRGLSFREYLDLEAASDIKHEYFEGQIFAMAGSTIPHAELTARVTGLLFVALRGGPCRPISSDARVRVGVTTLATYPDLSVVCGPVERDPEDPHSITNPTVLVEVLSPSTEGYDRGQKFEHYQRLQSLQDYVLVAQDRPRVERFHRLPDGTWTYEALGPGKVLQLSSIGSTLSIDELYDGLLSVPAA